MYFKIRLEWLLVIAVLIQIPLLPIDILMDGKLGFVDDILKVSFIVFSFFLILKNIHHIKLSKYELIYYLLSFFYVFSVFLVTLTSLDNSSVKYLNSVKELFRLLLFMVSLLLLPILVSKIGKIKDKYLYLLILYGLVLSVASIYNSFYGYAENLGRYVGSLVRAGADVFDSNLLSAILNIFTAMGIGMLILRCKKNLALVLIVLSFIGRSLTFSTSGWIGFAILIICSLIVLKSKFYQNYKIINAKFIFGATLISAISFLLILNFNLADIIFYRLNLSDEYVQEASVGSRVRQYENTINYIYNDFTALFSGVGISAIPSVTGTGYDMHNSILRALLSGGFVALISFMALQVMLFLIMFKCVNIDRFESKFDSLLAWTFITTYPAWFVQMQTLPADSSAIMLIYIVLGFYLLLINGRKRCYLS